MAGSAWVDGRARSVHGIRPVQMGRTYDRTVPTLKELVASEELLIAPGARLASGFPEALRRAHCYAEAGADL